MTLTAWVLLLSAAALSGGVGGYGGRALHLRLALSEIWDAIDALSRRLSKREGAAGRAVAVGNAKSDEFRAWGARLLHQRTDTARPTDEGAAVAHAREVFSKVDRKPTRPNGEET